MTRWQDWGLLVAVAVGSTLILWRAAGPTIIKQNFDGPYYAVVAKSWYNKEVIRQNFSFPLPLEYYPAHFPLFAAIMRLLSEVGGIDLVAAGVVGNLIFSVVAAVIIYEIFRANRWGEATTAALVWLFWWPRMWAVRSVAAPETLFVMATVLSVYFFEKQRYWLAALAGSLAVLTKSPGILLLGAYGLWLAAQYLKTKMLKWEIWPVGLIGVTLVGLFYFYYLKTGDFLAYFHSGDNIHLQTAPFQVFASRQPWVGDFWLEDVLWIYLVGAIGTLLAFKKSQVFGWFGAVFYTSVLFVSHRDIGRYALPLVPVVLVGLAPVLAKRQVKWTLGLLVVPLFFYTLNFLTHNTVAISDWAPFWPK